MNEEARARFTDIAGLPDENIHLDEAALLIAAEKQTDLDIKHYLTALGNLAIKFEQIEDMAVSPVALVNSLIQFIHVAEAFSGNATNYYDPENSYLNRVLDTRHGIPITLGRLNLNDIRTKIRHHCRCCRRCEIGRGINDLETFQHH